MPRVTVTPQAVATGYPTDGTTLTWTTGDATNHHQMPLTGREVLLARNSDDDTAYTVTITSATSSQNRTGDITADSIAFGATHMYGPFKLDGWRQSDGNLYFTCNNALILFAALRF